MHIYLYISFHTRISCHWDGHLCEVAFTLGLIFGQMYITFHGAWIHGIWFHGVEELVLNVWKHGQVNVASKKLDRLIKRVHATRNPVCITRNEFVGHPKYDPLYWLVCTYKKRVCVSMYTYVYIHIYICTHMYIWIQHMYEHVHMCVHVYTYQTG